MAAAPGARSSREDIWTDIAPLADRRLSPHHREILERESGIDPDIIQARGYHSLEVDQVHMLVLHQALAAVALQASSWLAIPTYQPNGTKHGEVVRLFGHGYGSVKYLWPSGKPLSMDIHPESVGHCWEQHVPVIFTEGIKKADAILSAARREDFPCLVVSLSGNYGWRATYTTDESRPLEDFNDLAWADRQVYVIVDSDFRANNAVRHGWTDMALYLQNRTGPHRTFLVPVPPGETTAKVGADDYLASGKTLASLLAPHSTAEYTLMQRRPASQPLQARRAKDVMEEAGDIIPHLLTPLIPESSITLLAGHTGTYKTWAALSLCLDLATSRPWFIHPRLKIRRNKPVASIYVNKEMSGRILGQRMKLLLRDDHYRTITTLETDLERVYVVDDPLLDLANPASVESLTELIISTGAELVVLDSLSMSWHGDENSASEVGTFYTMLRKVTQETGVAWVLIHHLLKPSSGALKKGDPITAAIRGSGQLVQQADVALLFSAYAVARVDDEKLITVTHAKARTDTELPAWVIRFTTPDGMSAVMEYHSSLTEAKAVTAATYPGDEKLRQDWITTALSEMKGLQPTSQGMTPGTIIAFLQANWPDADQKPPSSMTLRRTLEVMEAGGFLTKLGNGRTFLYRLAETPDDELSTPAPTTTVLAPDPGTAAEAPDRAERAADSGEPESDDASDYDR